jgi:hypothetical protein
MTIFGRAAVPFRRFDIALGYAQALLKQDADIALRLGIVLFGKWHP